MKLKVMYDINNMPSTAMLCVMVEELGFESLGPISEGYEVVGNIWHDKGNPNQTDFTQLEQALLAINSGLSFEVIE
jgi:hypothetical protein